MPYVEADDITAFALSHLNRPRRPRVTIHGRVADLVVTPDGFNADVDELAALVSAFAWPAGALVVILDTGVVVTAVHVPSFTVVSVVEHHGRPVVASIPDGFVLPRLLAALCVRPPSGFVEADADDNAARRLLLDERWATLGSVYSASGVRYAPGALVLSGAAR